MKKIFPDNIENILRIGIPLDKYGINNWALSKYDALEVLKKLKAINVVVAGGDVGEFKANTFDYNYDNWYCDPIENESRENYVKRSIELSEEYIRKYVPSVSTYFVLVIA